MGRPTVRAVAAGSTTRPNWPLNAAPVYWDSVGRRAFRQCQHGNFHWDLDDHAYVTGFSAKWATMPPWRCAGTDNCGCCRAG